MRYATISRELLPLLTWALTMPKLRPARTVEVDRPRTPTEDRLVAAASPLQGGPRYRPRRPAVLAAA
ncbi:hypothetical protein ACFRKE_09930 [Kitasatospora indigofera]|uniref:hypothetical protein n=1 Tax=Kitasatospora indigofera TaxID=67307 RepID=UPI0036C442CC